MSLEAQIEAKVKAAGTSFYWGMRMLEPARRAAMYAVYAFCREVDDIADEESVALDQRQNQLQQWRDDLERLFTGQEPDLLVAKALVGPVARFNLQRRDFEAVIDGVAMDMVGPVVRPDFATLDLYCDRVACAVGRLSVRVFGPWQPRADDVAGALGRALQLTNILRDVGEDMGLGRLYLPDELLSSYGIMATDPQEVMTHPLLPLVLRDMALLARRHFGIAATIMAELPASSMRPAALMRASYLAVLDKLEAANWQSLDQRVSLSRPLKLWYAVYYGFLRR
jgi:presqualene diphosphate synthase